MDGDELTLMVRHNHVPYTCLQTCQPWGLDGDVAAPETCTRQRSGWRGRTLPVSAELRDALAEADDRAP